MCAAFARASAQYSCATRGNTCRKVAYLQTGNGRKRATEKRISVSKRRRSRSAHCKALERTSDEIAVEESRAISERLCLIDSVAELQFELDAAKDRLVVVEVMADGMCETGLFEPDDGWTPDQQEREEAKLAVCEDIKHSYMRMAADAPSVRFLEVLEDPDNPSELAKYLEVSLFPSVLFFKGGKLAWRTDGSLTMQGNMKEGLLYFGDSSDPTAGPSRHVRELVSRDDFDAFVSGVHSNSKLQMVMVTTPLCSPCIHVYPSMVTLAANFQGLVDFARIEGDPDTLAMRQLFEHLHILEVPTFIVYRDGREVDRNVSSNRGDLIGHLLTVAVQNGINPPRPARKT